MNDNFNTITIEGNLAKDPETKEISGSKLIKFRICSSSRNEKTVYMDCEWWNPTRASEFLNKGKKVVIVGTLIPEEWTDKNGNKVNKLYIKVYSLELRPNATTRKEDTETASEDLINELIDSTKCDLPF